MAATTDTSRANRTTRVSPARLRGPILAVCVGGLGLTAFAVTAFSVFGDLADPRARTTRPRMPAVSMAAAMPALENGLPVSVPATAPVTAPMPVARADAPETIAGPRSGGAPEPVATVPRPATDATGSVTPPLRKAVRAGPAIENAAVVQPEARPAPVVAPLRLSKPIAPEKGETVRARAVEAKVATVPRAPNADPEGVAGRNTTDKSTAGKSTAGKSTTNKNAANKNPAGTSPAAKLAEEKVAHARPQERETTAPPPPVAPPRRSEPEDDDLGAKFSKGIKAIGGMLPFD